MANSTVNPADDEQLLRCWAHQDCRQCLVETGCSWCPFSSACVPNSYAVPLLAPAFDEGICPHWAERWEVRTRPLGCQVSTITTLTSLVSIASTLVFLLLVILLARFIRRLRKLNKDRPGWWRTRWYEDLQEWPPVRWLRRRREGGPQEQREQQEAGERPGESEPLLGA